MTRTLLPVLSTGLMLTGCAGDSNNSRGREHSAMTAAAEPADQEYENVVTGLDTPWGIDFLPDGRMIFTERGGRVSVLENGVRKTVGQIQTEEVGEGGVLGVAVHPDFSNNRSVYIYYTSGASNQVSRFTLANNTLSSETPILTSIPAARFHNGGRIKFGPDSKLYISTGDARQPQLAQSRDSLAGKILRIGSDGSIPNDNPFGNAVWAYGIRNCEGIDWNEAGELFASNHGPNRRDSIAKIVKGGDYGWPQTCDERGDFIPALRCYTDWTLAPGGLAASDGFLYVPGLEGEQMQRFRITADGITNEVAMMKELGRLRTMLAHEGWLYLSTSNRDGRGNPRPGDDRIVRFRPAP